MYSWFLLLAVVLEGHYKDWINGYSTIALKQVCAQIHIYTHVTYIRILNCKKPFPLDLFFSYKEKMRFWSVEWLAWVGIQIHPAGPRARTSFTALPCPHSLHPLRELDWGCSVSHLISTGTSASDGLNFCCSTRLQITTKVLQVLILEFKF